MATKQYDVFLSHHSADKPVVEFLARKLEEAGVRPFLDQWHLIPGEPIQEALEAALDQSATCAFFLGAKGSGPWANEEMRAALAERVHNSAFRVIPVLLPGVEPEVLDRLPHFLKRLLWVDFRAGLENEEAFQRLLAGVRGYAPKFTRENASPEQIRLACPYRGLSAFREEDEEFFFGRETYTTKLIDAVQRQPFLAVLGASGSGKSSLVHAGLIPYLKRQRNWIIACFRPLTSPWYELANVLVPLLEPDSDEIDRIEQIEKLTAKFSSGAIPLASILKRLTRKSDESRVLLFIDQFEELYTLCRDDFERQRFLDELLGVQIPVCHVLLTMRADFLGKAISYRPFADALQNANLVIGPMNSEELCVTITEPAKLLAVKIEDGLTNRILEAVGDQSGNLPLLEFALTKLWEKQVNGTITHAAYGEIGGVKQALALYADAVYDELNPDEQARVQKIFTQLVRPGEGTEDTRRVATFSNVGEENRTLVTKLATARLVVTGRSKEAGETVEVVHEALIKSWQKLQDWMNVDRDFRVWQEHLRVAMQQWKESGEDTGALLRGSLLAEAERWLKERETDLDQEEQQFIRDSIQFQQKAKIGELDALSLLASALFINDKEGSLAKAVEAAEKLRDIQSLVQKKDNPIYLRTVSALQQAIYDVKRERCIFNAYNGTILAVTFDLQGCLFAAEISDQIITIWDVTNKSKSSQLHGDFNNLSGVRFSQDGCLFISVNIQGEITFWNSSDGNKLSTIESSQNITSIDVSPDNTFLAIGTRDNTSEVWHIAEGRRIYALQGHTGWVSVVKFSPTEQQLASGSADHTIKLWDLKDGCEIKTFQGYTDRLWQEYELLKEQADLLRMTFNRETNISPSELDTKLAMFNTLVELANKLEEVDRVIQGFDRKLNPYPQTIAFNANSTRLAGTAGEVIYLWDTTTGQIVQTLRGHLEAVNCMTFYPNSHILISGSDDHTIKLWDATKGDEIITLRSHSEGLHNLSISRSGEALISKDQHIYLQWYFDIEQYYHKEAAWIDAYKKQKPEVRLEILQRDCDSLSQKLMAFRETYVIRSKIFQNTDSLLRQESQKALQGLQREYTVLSEKFTNIQDEFAITVDEDPTHRLQTDRDSIIAAQQALKETLESLARTQDFDPLLGQAMIEFVINLPQIEVENHRKALLLYAFGVNDKILQHIDYTGGNRDFVTCVLRTLIEYPLLSNGQEAFILFTEALESQVGQDKKIELCSLRDWFKKTTTVPTPLAIDARLQREIRDFLLSQSSLLFSDIQSSRALVHGAGLRQLTEYIEIAGSPHQFISQFIEFLGKYGTLGKEALRRFLEVMEQLVNPDDRMILKTFQEKLSEK